MSNFNIFHHEPIKHYSTVTRLVHYASKFSINDHSRHPKQQLSTKNRRVSISLDHIDRLIENKKPRFAPIWPEWNEADVINESWDATPKINRNRNEAKTNPSSVIHAFEDPEGKIELPPILKIEQWKRPSEFLPSNQAPVIVDLDLGVDSFDLITANEHLHNNEAMRCIISQITSLWDICQKGRKSMNNIYESNALERTWRPWDHIYALSRTSKRSSITPFNPAGKYAIRLFFLGSWRKIIIDDTIPFDAENRCLLPQTSLSHELWPMLLSKALLKILCLDFVSSSDISESNETSVIHALTGWLPEFIPLKYSHAEKIWNYLRHDRSNKFVYENRSNSLTSFGPVNLFKWVNKRNPSIRDDTLNKMTNNQHVMKNFDENYLKSNKKLINNIHSNRMNGSAHHQNGKEIKRVNGLVGRSATTDDIPISFGDAMNFEAPKMVVLATMSSLQGKRMSSLSEIASRSERLRRYNISETFSTSMVLKSIRDIPLGPPATLEQIPAWKLIRPRKKNVLPHAEIPATQPTKPERWIEIASPYINYPTSLTTLSQNVKDSSKNLKDLEKDNIFEVDENDVIDNERSKSDTAIKLDRHLINLKNKEIQENISESAHDIENKLVRDLLKTPRKSTANILKTPLDNIQKNEIIVMCNNSQTNSNNIGQLNLVQEKKPYMIPKIWMDFDDFCTCFTSIVIFHNPRGYQYSHKHTEVKFIPYQQPASSPTSKDRKKDFTQPVVQHISNLQDEKSPLYCFVDSTQDTLNINTELIISLTCLSRWYEIMPHEQNVLSEKIGHGMNVTNEKFSMDLNLSKNIGFPKETMSQKGSLYVEVYSWKRLSMGQPILRLHTTGTKAALLTLPPGRHVLKFITMYPFAFTIQILSNTNQFMLCDEDQLLNKISSVSEDAEFIDSANKLFLVLEQSVRNFHLVDRQEYRLSTLLRLFCERFSDYINLQSFLHAFYDALYSTIRSTILTLGNTIDGNTQFAWRCFTNDLVTSDILAAYETKRPSASSANRHSARAGGSASAGIRGVSSNKKHSNSKDRSQDEKPTSKHSTSIIHSSSMSDVQEEFQSDILKRELNKDEMYSIVTIQKCIRGFLQRCIIQAHRSRTDINLRVQRALLSSMSLLKMDRQKSAVLLLKNFISIKPQLIQYLSFCNDDWNMVTYRDYHGIYQEQPINTWFILFRDIFYVDYECLIVAKLLSSLPNSILRIIDNDTYAEKSLVFNRLVPTVLTKNRHGYTLFAEGISNNQSAFNGRFRLRLITSYTRLPEMHTDQITSSFVTKEIMDYYLPNSQQIICRYRVIVTDDNNQTGRNYHLASIYFSASKPDVLLRLSVFDDNEEIASVEGNGSVVLPAILFMRAVNNSGLSQSSRPVSKTGARKKDMNGGRRGSISDTATINYARLDKDKIESGTEIGTNSRPGLSVADEIDKPHKYFIQVSVLHKTWPLTLAQWQFVEQLKEQERNESKIFHEPITQHNSTFINDKGRNNSYGNSKMNRSLFARSNHLKFSVEKMIDTDKPHWILQIVSDVDKSDELIIKKDTERIEELMNMKKAWETFENGRAEKAFRTRQKFLDSLHYNDRQPQLRSISSITDDEILFHEPSIPHSKIIFHQFDKNNFLKKKLVSHQPIVFNSSFEQEDIETRQKYFIEYSKFIDELDRIRENDRNNLYQRKLFQLNEYINLHNRIHETRSKINETREIFRQRHLEIERKRLEELALQEKKLIDEENAKLQAAALLTKKQKQKKKKRKQ